MELNRRQLQILMLLANHHDWITSEKLAEHLNVNKKTVQSEIKSIMEISKDKLDLQTNNRLGYQLVFISMELQTKVLDEASKHKIYSSMNSRASSIIIYLLFQDAYVSMQKLADIFFLSKTAVALELKTISRWIKRNENIDLEVSPTKGLKIHADEDMRRIFASMAGSDAVLQNTNLDELFVERLFELILKTQKILQRVLIEFDYIASGEDYIRFARYLALTVARSEKGYELEATQYKGITSSIITTLVESLSNETGYRFTKEEVNAIGNRLFQLNYISAKGGNSQEIGKQLKDFDQRIINFLDLPISTLFTKPSFFIAHINQMKNRIEYGHNVMNHFAKKIILTYPLETYLVSKFFPISFNIRPNFAEIAYLVLYLAVAVEPHRYQDEVLMISNQPFSLLNTLKQNLQKILGSRLVNFQVEPIYLYEIHPEIVSDFDFLLSTEQEFVFKNSNFFYIPSFLSVDELEEINEKFSLLIHEKEIRNNAKLLEQYFPDENRIRIVKKIDSVHDLIAHHPSLEMWRVDSNTLFACQIQDGGVTFIREYRLEKSVMYEQNKINRIIHVSFDKKSSKRIMGFFLAITNMFKQKMRY